MTVEKIAIDEKYEILIDMKNNKFEALRHGEQWRDLIGDNLILAMVYKILNLQHRTANTTEINDLMAKAYKNAIEKGWHEDPRSFGDEIALMHSELSEALEDYRNGRGLQEIYYEGEKPCGIPTELADAVIRIFHVCGHLGIDLEAAILEKMAYNATRPVRHGGKKL